MHVGIGLGEGKEHGAEQPVADPRRQRCANEHELHIAGLAELHGGLDARKGARGAWRGMAGWFMLLGMAAVWVLLLLD